MERNQIDSYLFNEMSEAEREKFEDGFIGDDDAFVEVAERENELVDLYVAGGLFGDELARFERSLEAVPSRRQKVANAKTLHEFIADERPALKTITIAEREGFFARLFRFNSPAFQFASVAAILLLTAASIFLLVENRRLGSIESELASARTREAELVSQIEGDRDATESLTADLDAERERIRNLEAELKKLQQNPNDRQPTNVSPSTIATLILSPALIRGGGPVPAKRLELDANAKRVSIILELPPEHSGESRVVVVMNGEVIGSRTVLKNKRVVVGFDRARLKPGRNQIFLSPSDGSSKIAEYFFSVAGAE